LQMLCALELSKILPARVNRWSSIANAV
jgi:hypothetical protein